MRNVSFCHYKLLLIFSTRPFYICRCALLSEYLWMSEASEEYTLVKWLLRLRIDCFWDIRIHLSHHSPPKKVLFAISCNKRHKKFTKFVLWRDFLMMQQQKQLLSGGTNVTRSESQMLYDKWLCCLDAVSKRANSSLELFMLSWRNISRAITREMD